MSALTEEAPAAMAHPENRGYGNDGGEPSGRGGRSLGADRGCHVVLDLGSEGPVSRRFSSYLVSYVGSKISKGCVGG